MKLLNNLNPQIQREALTDTHWPKYQVQLIEFNEARYQAGHLIQNQASPVIQSHNRIPSHEEN